MFKLEKNFHSFIARCCYWEPFSSLLWRTWAQCCHLLIYKKIWKLKVIQNSPVYKYCLDQISSQKWPINQNIFQRSHRYVQTNLIVCKRLKIKYNGECQENILDPKILNRKTSSLSFKIYTVCMRAFISVIYLFRICDHWSALFLSSNVNLPMLQSKSN